jgi:hypothetical protein
MALDSGIPAGMTEVGISSAALADFVAACRLTIKREAQFSQAMHDLAIAKS